MPKKFQVGDNDPYIASIQQSINEKMGANGAASMPFKAYLKPDGGFGPKTRDALQAFQASIGLPASGIYDTGTAMVLDPYIEFRFLTESDYVNTAKELNCEVAMVKAVTDVESKDFGFFENGKPAILFERHVFRQQLLKAMKASTGVAMNVAKLLGIGVSVTGPDINLIDMTMASLHGDIYSEKAGGYVGGIPEYARMEKAQAYHKEAALMSASWGCFQLMGYHFAALGYASIDDFVTRMYRCEDEHIAAFARFVKINPSMWGAIRSKQFLVFARAYNGPNQQGYDKRISDAYDKHK